MGGRGSPHATHIERVPTKVLVHAEPIAVATGGRWGAAGEHRIVGARTAHPSAAHAGSAERRQWWGLPAAQWRWDKVPARAAHRRHSGGVSPLKHLVLVGATIIVVIRVLENKINPLSTQSKQPYLK